MLQGLQIKQKCRLQVVFPEKALELTRWPTYITPPAPLLGSPNPLPKLTEQAAESFHISKMVKQPQRSLPLHYITAVSQMLSEHGQVAP